MQFPAIPIWGATQRVYALSLVYGVVIFRLARVPFIAILLVTMLFDVINLALGLGGEGQRDWLAIAISAAAEVLVEVVILNFLAIRIFRLLLLEHNDERTLFDSKPLLLLPRYAAQYLGIMLVVIALVCAGWFVAQASAGFLGAWAALLLVPFVFAAYLFYCWLSFVLPAAAIPVKYRFQESSVATKGAISAIAVVTLFAVVPWFTCSFLLTQFVGADVGPTSWMYWVLMPLIAVLHCIRTVFFVLANAVCFEERTGWHPDAEKVDL